MKKDNKKAIAFFALAIVASLAFTLFGVVGRASAETAYTGSAECMIVLERDSGRVLNEKNADKKRDPEMHSAKKGNNWHFGKKMHIGVTKPQDSSTR